MKQRLHKILAMSTELSRRSAEKAIEAGEISVNGRIVRSQGVLVDPETDAISWKGMRVRVPRGNIYIIYNKPKNRLVTKHDPQGRDTIWKDLRKFVGQVNAVGRLDYESEGLLILTNDGELINRLTHPSHEIEKMYNVKVKGFPKESDLAKLRTGITSEGVAYLPAQVKIRYETLKNAWIETKIKEGKNRQIRKMYAEIGFPVLKLKRITIGSIRLGKLETGKWRFLKSNEVHTLLVEAGMRAPAKQLKYRSHRIHKR